MGNNGLVGKFEGKPKDMVSIIYLERNFHQETRQRRIYGEIVYSNSQEVCVIPICPGNKRDEDRRKLLKLRDCLSYSVNA